MAWPVRYKMIGLLFLSTMINYIDRVNISVAAPVMRRETGWDEGLFGIVFSAFLIGYALLQIPGGVLADRWSGRKVLALAFCGFSLFTALTPLGQYAFVILLAMRFLVGAFESVTIPALTSLNSRWIPRSEFGRAQTFSLSGITVGQMIAYPLTVWIIERFSWEVVFYVNAIFGFIWAAAWLWYATDTPAAHPRIGHEERHYIETNLPPRPAEPLSVRALFSSLSLLVLASSYMCFAFVGWTFFFWFPTYLVEGRGLSMAVMGTAGIVVHGAGFVGIIGGGALSDWLLRRGWSGQFARVRFAGIAVALSLPFMLGAVLVPSAMMSVGCLVLFYLLFASAIAGYTTVALEFNPHLAGAIFGLLNTLGSVSGVFGPAIAGFLLVRSGGDWIVPFSVLTAVGAAGAVILLLVRITPIHAEALTPSGVVAREAAR